MADTLGKVGILVGGGPAPGINGVIAAVTIEAIRKGYEVYGIYEGYRWLVKGDKKALETKIKRLEIDHVSRIHFDGGAFLKTSRTNPTAIEGGTTNAVKMLKEFGIQYLVTIGGDDTASGATAIAKAAKEMGDTIKFVHVPKTIDNDLPLPHNLPTFGYQTARDLGTKLVQNLMEDARTTDRWYIVVAMGRTAGHLTLGITKSAGATLAIIPEEFGYDSKGKPNKVPFAQICDIFEAAIFKRRAMKRNHGVIVVAEGVIENLDPQDLLQMGIVLERDPFDHPILGNVDLGKLIKNEIEKRFKARGEEFRTMDINIGYVLRCADPIPFDEEYTRDLGYHAAHYLLDHQNTKNVLICVNQGALIPIDFSTLIDPTTKKVAVRHVDIHSPAYDVARRYMVRLEKQDLENNPLLTDMAKAAEMKDGEEFKKKYSYLV